MIFIFIGYEQKHEICNLPWQWEDRLLSYYPEIYPVEGRMKRVRWMEERRREMEGKWMEDKTKINDVNFSEKK